MSSRRDLLKLLLASPVAFTIDVERLLWVPTPTIVVPAMPTVPSFTEVDLFAVLDRFYQPPILGAFHEQVTLPKRIDHDICGLAPMLYRMDCGTNYRTASVTIWPEYTLRRMQRMMVDQPSLWIRSFHVPPGTPYQPTTKYVPGGSLRPLPRWD